MDPVQFFFLSLPPRRHGDRRGGTAIRFHGRMLNKRRRAAVDVMESLQLSDMGKTTSLGIFQFSQVDSVITKWIVEGQLCAHSVDGRVWPLK